jgi:hypothetical protein
MNAVKTQIWVAISVYVLVAIVQKHLNDDLLGGYTNAAGTSPPVFSIMQKPVSDAQKMGSAFEKSVLIPQTMVWMTKTIAWIAETKVSTAGNMVSGTSTTVSAFEKMVSRLENIFSTTKTMVKMGCCWKL